MFIIDLDDTLLDTQAFKEARIKALQDIGVAMDVYNASYAIAYRNVLGVHTYNDETHAQVLATYGFDEDVIKQIFKKIRSRLSEFLFSDTLDFLHFLKEKNQRLILLSLGQSDFQKMKVEGTGIGEYFDQVFTTDIAKQEVVEKIINQQAEEQGIWFINDKPEETKEITHRFSHIKSILKISPKFSVAEYQATGIPFFKTLTEIKQYVQQHLA